MERRNFIKAGIATGVLATQFLGINTANAADKKTESKSSGAKLEVALAHCMQTGYACVAHCMDELANGNKDMAECNKTVHDMLASCEAMLKLSSYKSDLAKSMATLCAKACDNCAAACKKHSDHWAHGMHLACKECYEACLECSKLCKAA